MRYHCLHIKTSFAEEWQKDIFFFSFCELGVDTIDSDDYYIPSDVWEANSSIINHQLSMIEEATLLSITPCPDENWNATWEAEHPIQELPLGIRIIPHCAFGAGHHETTSMMIQALISHQSEILNHKPFRVLDHGTGTGVLAIFAKRLGADYVLAIDIDDKSVTNARENAALNDVEIEVQLGSTPPTDKQFDLILANIHLNILLENMPAYANALVEKGELWLSGFYEEDCQALQEAAETNGLQLKNKTFTGNWHMLQFIRHGFCG